MSYCSLDSAACYQAEGWAVIAIPRPEDQIWDEEWAATKVAAHKRGKVPLETEWQKIRYPTYGSLKEDFRPHRDEKNIGVILGAPSGGLVDIDLDCPEAIALAPAVLPPTFRFGRKSKPGSHWLYKSNATRTQKWMHGKEMLLELRSNGGQTVFPGSVHPSGERIKWESIASMAYIDGAVLESFCAYIANRVLLDRGVRLEPSKPKPIAKTYSGDKFAKYEDAVVRFTADHEIPDRCPHCIRKDAWKIKEGKWFCFHSSHPHEFGGRGSGCNCGDVVDIYAWGDGLSRGDYLRKSGYLASPNIPGQSHF